MTKGPNLEIVNSSALTIPLRSSMVNLTVTSPPYHNAIDYDRHIREEWYRGNLGKNLELYLDEMSRVFAELNRITIEGGFCCVVIGNEVMDGTLIPLPHLLTQRMVSSHPLWNFHEEIIWNKITGGLDRFGSTIQRPFPSYYRANIMHEHILVFRKGELKRKRDLESKFEIDDIMKKEVSNSIWNITPVPPRYINHPCPFPEEIPLRLIMLYSNKGDLVIDPFLGSGQTGKAAKYLSRRFFGLDVQRRYCELSRTRIETEDLHIRSRLLPKWEKVSG